MKNNQNKGFTFKVADKQKQTQVKTRDGVATAGCTRVTTQWGFTDWKNDWLQTQGQDDGFFC